MNTPTASPQPKRHSRNAARRFDQFLRDVRLISGGRPRPRNAKIARLPEPTRILINQMLDDGVPYKTILAKIQPPQDASTPLLRNSALRTPQSALHISEMNLSNWYHGGYQDWRRVQAAAALVQTAHRAGACADLSSSQIPPDGSQSHLIPLAKAESAEPLTLNPLEKP